jgi:peptide/nickel transport system ATP-binding protein
MPDTPEPLLAIDDLSVSFLTRAGEIPAVRRFSAAIGAGEALGLVGESGCGKSTVALAIMRDLGAAGRIVGGRVRFRGRDLVTMPERDLRRVRGAEIAMVYQEPMASLNPAMRIGRQLMEVPMIHEGARAAAARAEARRMVEAVRLPDPDRILDSYPHQLSGGQQQRVVIAMALMAKPALLILDEPTTALDVTVEAGIVELVKDLGRELGTAMLFISHNLGLVRETCDRLCVMYAGEAVETGPIPEIFRAMRHPYTQGLLRAIPRPGADRGTRPLLPIPGSLPAPQARPPGCSFGPRCGHFVAGRCDAMEIPMEPVTPAHATRCIRWTEIDWAAPPPAEASAPPAPPGAVVLRVDDLEKRYAVAPSLFGGDPRVIRANAAVSFAAREAETLAIVGESGCGKSTLAKLLLGLETASGGTIRLDGVEIGRRPVEARDPRTVAAIQMVFQNPFDTLNPSRRVGAQIVRVLEKFGVGRTPAQREARMLGLLDLVKLPRAFADRMPRQLSGGQKQRIGIARAFAGAPAVVVADEPVSALDVSVQAAVTELLIGIQRERRTTLLLISHDLGLVRYLADRVIVMYLGHVVETGTTAQVFAPPYHPYTEALLSAMPIADPRVEKARVVLEGEIPSALDPPPGCPFQTRCPRKHQVPGDLCETVLPPFVALAEGHGALCHLPAEVFASMRPVIRDPERDHPTAP